MRGGVAMKKLVVVRHGDYGDDGHLNEAGVKQLEGLASKLAAAVGTGKVLILSSPAIRTKESAEIISLKFNSVPETTEWLFVDVRSDMNLPAVLQLVDARRDEMDCVILVTHGPYVRDFPVYFGKQALQVVLEIDTPVNEGEAVFVDCVEKKLVIFRSSP